MKWSLCFVSSLLWVIVTALQTSAFIPPMATRRDNNIMPLQLSPIDEATLVASTTQPIIEEVHNIASGLLSTENIKTAFSIATFGPQLPWLFLILLPNSGVTKKLLGGYEIVTICCLVHFFIVSASIAQPDGTAPMVEFADVFDPNGDPQKAMVGMMQYPNFVSEEWSHVLTWDLFVGRWIWLDGLRRGVFTSHSVLTCNLIGPPGLLLHWVTCTLTGKGLLRMETEE